MASPATPRPCRTDEVPAILAIINDAAQAYRGIIPDDCWHDPYMTGEALQAEIADGVTFLGADRKGVLRGGPTVRSCLNSRGRFDMTHPPFHRIASGRSEPGNRPDGRDDP